MKKLLFISFIMLPVLTACNFPTAVLPTLTAPQTNTHTPTPISTETPVPTNTSTSIPTETQTPSPTSTPTLTDTPTPTQTDTPLPTETPTITPSPTETLPTVTAEKNAQCRWGPGTAYISSGVTLYEGESALVEGRNESFEGTWFWVQTGGVEWHCWVHTSTVSINVEPRDVPYVAPNLPVNEAVQPPTNVQASRERGLVTITWNPAPAAVGLGYLIVARTCMGGVLADVVYSTTDTAFSLLDDNSCSDGSSGGIRTYNKLGYSHGVGIPWPAPED